MAGFLYFRAVDQRPIDLSATQKWGLGYSLDSIECRAAQGEQTPSKGPGLCFGDAKRNQPLGIKVELEKQTWRKMPTVEGRPELYVGYWNESKPGPEDLKRPQMIAGDFVQLDDGNLWKVPRVRSVDNTGLAFECALPKHWDCDDQGRWFKGSVVETHRHLFDLTSPFAERMFKQEIDDNVPDLDDQQVNDAAVALLKANYCIDVPEIVLLRLFSDTSPIHLIPLLANHYMWFLDKIDELQKKSESPSTETGLNLPSGETAGT